MRTEKHIKITGYSTTSWKDAINKTIEEVSKTIQNLSHITILEQSATIAENKIIEYMVTLDLKFFIDNAKRTEN